MKASTSFVVTLKNGVATGQPVAVTTMAGDERWPSWTADGRLVFAHRDARPAGRGGDPSLQYDIYSLDAGVRLRRLAGAAGADRNRRQRNVSARVAGRHQGRVHFRARFGRRSRFVVDAGAGRGDRQADSAWRPAAEAGVLVRASRPAPTASRCARFASRACAATKPIRRGRPTTTRIAFYAVREGIGSVWVATAEPPRPEPTEDPMPRAKPAAQPQLVSRRGGAPAWSPDGKTLLVTGLPDPQPVYNGNPLRNEVEAPPLFALNAAFQLWRVAAPLPVHEDGGAVAAEIAPSPALFGAVFDRVWTTLKSLYYSSGRRRRAVGERARPVPPARDRRRRTKRISRPSSTRWSRRSR